MAKSSYIIVLGCSRLGAYIANHLSQLGHSVVVVDEEESSFSLLSPDFSGFRIEGNPVELAVLRQAKIDKADFVVVTTRDDNINIMVAQVAKEVFKVPEVLARVFDPDRQEVYNSQNIKTICPTSVAGDLFISTFNSLLEKQD
jgi:trk system potassium uptake protein TrkA